MRSYFILRVTVVIGLIACLNTAACQRSAEPPSVATPSLPAEIASHVSKEAAARLSLVTQTTDDFGRVHHHYRIMLDPNRETLDLSNTPGGHSISAAAQLYALATGDFEVSLEDLVQTGYLPFNLGWMQKDLEQEIPNSPIVPLLDGITDITSDIGAPSWTVYQRQKLLMMSYRDYANMYDGLPVGDSILPPLDELPRYNNFWQNPYTRKPAKESTAIGDLTLSSPSSLWSNRTDVPTAYQESVPCFNVTEVPLDKGTSADEFCWWFGQTVSTIPANTQTSRGWSGRCPDRVCVPGTFRCDVYFSFSCDVDCVDYWPCGLQTCEGPPEGCGGGGFKRHIGGTIPMYEYNWNGCAVTATKVCTACAGCADMPHPPQPDPTDWVYVQACTFLDDLQNSGTYASSPAWYECN